MGYRSDVAYVIGFTNTQLLNEFIAKVMAVGTEYQVDALKECQIANDDARINYYAEGVKWYDSFEYVQAHEELLELAIECTPKGEAGYRFVRIGEEANDIEHKWGGHYELAYEAIDIVRRITVDFDEEYEPIGDALCAISTTHSDSQNEWNRESGKAQNDNNGATNEHTDSTT